MASISSLFGYVLNFIYNLVHNYGIAIIIFSILSKLALLPMSIKQQKTMKKNAKLQVKVKEIQNKYKNNTSKMNQEMMDLYKRENMSPFSGCLSSILQIVLLIAMFGLVRNPLTYMLKIDQEIVNKVAQYIKIDNNDVNQAYPQISILKYVSKNRDKVINLKELEKEEKNNEDITENAEQNEQSVEKINEDNIEIEKETIDETILDSNNDEEKINLEDLYINMNFAGLDLSNIPKENWNDWTVFIIPVLYVVTSIISMKLTTKLTEKNKENEPKVIEIKKEDEEDNSEKGKEEDLSPEEMTAQMSKSMTWFLPIMSVSISLIAPLGLALYWLVNNSLMIIERLLINKLIKSDEEDGQNE